jgi:hypothetical protein
MADIVVESLDATVALDNSTAANVTAALDNNVGKVLGKDASFALTYSKSGQGKYKLHTTNPVIVAVAVVQQPKTGRLEGNESQSWKGWGPDAHIRVRTDPH